MSAIIKTNGTSAPPSTCDLSWGEDYGQSQCLDDAQMIEMYQSRKKEAPGALISINECGGGGWTVAVHETGAEKQAFYAQKLLEMWSELFKRFAIK